MPGAVSCPRKVPTPLSHGAEPASGPVLSFPVGSPNHLLSAQEVTGPFDCFSNLDKWARATLMGLGWFGLEWMGICPSDSPSLMGPGCSFPFT